MTDAGATPTRVAVPRAFMAMVGSFVAIAPLSTDFYLPVMPRIATDLHASASQTELVITAVLLGMALGQLVGGPLSDQRGRKGTLVAGLIGFVVTTALSALAPNLAILIVIRLLSGLAVALVFVVSRAMVADVYPGGEAARGFALLGAITGITPVLAPLIGGVLALVMGWRGIFLTLAGIGIVIVVIAVAFLPETMPVHARQRSGVMYGLRDLGACLRSRAFMAYVGTLAAGGGILFGYISNSPFVLEDGFGISTTQFSLVFAVNSIGIFSVAFLGRRVMTRFGPERLLWAGQAQALVGTALALAGLLAHSLPLVLAGLFLAISSGGLVFATSTALGIGHSPVRAGSASALLGIAGFLVGGLLGPLGGLGAVPFGILIVVFASAGLLIHRVVPPHGPSVRPAHGPSSGTPATPSSPSEA